MPSAEHQITTELSEDELLERLRVIETPTTVDDADLVSERYGIDLAATRTSTAMEPDLVDTEYRIFEPLENAADEYIRFAQTPEKRVYTGIHKFDAAMRGIAPGELLLITGFSANGKTLITSEILRKNRHRRVAMFSPDETRVLVLVKLCALEHGISAEVLEQRIAAGDQQAIEMVRSTARDLFPTLAVFDQMVGIQQMDHAVAEAAEAFGGPIELCIFDYSELLLGFESPPAAVTALKGFGKAHDLAMCVLHQSSRTGGADGKKPTMTSGGYGGEQQATFLIGVRRKKNELEALIRDLTERINTSTKDPEQLIWKREEAEADLRHHRDTVSAALLKCKRPPARTVDEIDFRIDGETGRIQELQPGELANSLAHRDAQQAAIAPSVTTQSAVAAARSATPTWRQLRTDEEPF